MQIQQLFSITSSVGSFSSSSSSIISSNRRSISIIVPSTRVWNKPIYSAQCSYLESNNKQKKLKFYTIDQKEEKGVEETIGPFPYNSLSLSLENNYLNKREAKWENKYKKPNFFFSFYLYFLNGVLFFSFVFRKLKGKENRMVDYWFRRKTTYLSRNSIDYGDGCPCAGYIFTEYFFFWFLLAWLCFFVFFCTVL